MPMENGSDRVNATPSLIRSFRQILFFGLALGLGIVSLVQIYLHYGDYSSIDEMMRAGFVEHQKRIIQREVLRIVDRIEYHKSILERLAGEKAQQRVDLAVEITQNMLRHQAGKPIEQVKASILDALRAMRFDAGVGYFFVLDPQGVTLLHPNQPELEGQNVRALVDTAGTPFIKQLLGLALDKGEGAITYTFSKPGREGNGYAKTSYVKQLKEIGWVIGTGVYLDDLEEQEKIRLLSEIQEMRYGINGYLFVDDWQGRVLANGAQPNLVGQNIWEYQDINGIKVVQRLIAAAQTEQGDFVHYSWKKPDNGLTRSKISFAMGIPDWQWVIGTGVYTDDIESTITHFHQAIYLRVWRSVLSILVGAALVGVFLYLWINRLHQSILADLNQFRRFFSKAATSEASMDDEGLLYSEHRELAIHVNGMLAAKLEAEQRLMEQQTHLEETVRERTLSLEQKSLELEHMAMTDVLTGIHNRRSFSDLTAQHLKEQVRYPMESCLVMLDIDLFKSVNDQYGHEVGDGVLKMVTETIEQQLRAPDVFGRWGGEEFTLLLPHTPISAGIELCQRLCRTLAEQSFTPVGTVTASFGVTSIIADDDVDSLIRRADQALYAAKRAGRNRVESI